MKSVFARRFAQRGRVCRHVQNVIDDLEGQANGRPVFSQRQQGGIARLAAKRAHHHAGFEQCTGFQPMHLVELVGVQRQPHTGQVDRLPAGHALSTRSLGQHPAQPGLGRCINRCVCWCQQLKSQRLQRITYQQRLSLAKLDMHRWLAAAQHIVVHARHVVVHQ